MARPASRLVAMGLVLGTLAWVARDSWRGRAPLRAPPIRVTQAYATYADTLGRRETLSDVLTRGGIVGRDYTALLAAAVDLPVRRLRAGQVFEFRRLVTDSTVDQLSLRVSPERRVRLERLDAHAWRETADTIPWVVTRLRVTGVIARSLYDALDNAMADSILPEPERRALAWALADVYDWEVDFTRDVHPGDQFRVLLEQLRSAEGERRFGRILAAEVDIGRSPNYAFLFASDSSAAVGYYDERGRSLKRAFLRAPLQFRRVSSRFGTRYHPLLHVLRHHDGVDFAAAYGTPVRATADGIVTIVGRDDGGYGNLIELRHVNGIRTRYGHLSAFARSLHVGERVEQGETIGYVGSTGLSTGPHLHYELLVNGRATDPLRRDAAPGTPVAPGLRAAYDAVRLHLQTELDPTPHAVSFPRVD